MLENKNTHISTLVSVHFNKRDKYTDNQTALDTIQHIKYLLDKEGETHATIFVRENNKI